MTTPLTVMDHLYAVIQASPLATEITGRVTKIQRPTGSNKEDIVIGTLPLNLGGSIKRLTANVNIYVPDITLTIDGTTQRQPDLARLAQLAGMALETLTHTQGEGFATNIVAQAIIAEPAINQHFINHRIDYINLNTP